MTEHKKDLYYLEDLSDYKVADDYPDVRGWAVLDTDDRNIGTVDSLLVSKSAERVVYLDVLVDQSIVEAGHEVYGAKADGVHEYLNKDGDDHLIVPIGMVDFDEKQKIVRSGQITYQTFAKTNRFSKGTGINREYEIVVYGTYFPESEELADDQEFYDRKGFNRFN
ncbi:PRC-barrel domain-containing protein [Mucilaginibacter litoreus]|uniref:PRC-barrel domain-containing protein n=1 Tax=Mucilaginibacter litoreus TaxID=1048221 RepID=A0ABW3AWY5_9SPHI